MKKLLFIALAIMMVGCWNDGDIVTNHRVAFVSVVYDSCEYIISNVTDRMAHKGNCKYCTERRKQEMRELIKELKSE